MAENDEKKPDQRDELDELFGMFPEGTRIIIKDGKVMFENLTGDLLDVAKALNPDDPNLKERT